MPRHNLGCMLSDEQIDDITNLLALRVTKQGMLTRKHIALMTGTTVYQLDKHWPRVRRAVRFHDEDEFKIFVLFTRDRRHFTVKSLAEMYDASEMAIGKAIRRVRKRLRLPQYRAEIAMYSYATPQLDRAAGL